MIKTKGFNLKEYFGFMKLPFSREIKPDELYPSKQMQELFQFLSYLLNGRGIGLVTGEVGSGKSTLLRAFAEGLERSMYNIVYLSDPTIGTRGILRDISAQLSLEPGYFKWDLMAKVKGFVQKSFSDQNKITFVIFDEAQHLSIPMLEELRLLTNFQMDSISPLTIVFLGQPDLRKKLNLKTLEALNQRISFKYHLVGLSKEETKEYIIHQLKIAGRTDHLFSDDAIDSIFQESKGIPRLINNLCTSCLFRIKIEDKNVVDKLTVESVLYEEDLL